MDGLDYSNSVLQGPSATWVQSATALDLLNGVQAGCSSAADRLGGVLPSLTATAESGDETSQNVLGIWRRCGEGR